MKLTKVQIERLTRKIFDELKAQNIVTFKVPEDKAFRRGMELIEEQYQIEKNIEIEARQMVETLEKQNPGGFERHKMFLMIKKKLAKDKGVIL